MVIYYMKDSGDFNFICRLMKEKLNDAKISSPIPNLNPPLQISPQFSSQITFFNRF